MPFAIYPSIGFARLGNSPTDFFIGPEKPSELGIEIQSDGTELPVIRFKDSSFRLKRQAARFRIFDISDPAAPREAVLPAGSIVRWTVSLANRKDAVRRPNLPPPEPVAIIDDPTRADRVISATETVSGASSRQIALSGQYRGATVDLGHLLTDSAQRLIVLGGSGRSGSLSNPPASLGADFYNNPDWFDDVGDGSVSAVVKMPGQEAEIAKGAWVIVAPPDFAPPASGVVTLFDVIREIAIEEGWIHAPTRPFFESDIRPMIERASSLQHVDGGAAWATISQDWAALSNPGPASAPLRANTRVLVKQVENILHDFELRTWQSNALDAWVAGNFHPGAAPDRGACDALTRSALDGALGQGFFPGIEAGVSMIDPGRYDPNSFEFRLSHSSNRPGDMTALMALPWQADFLKCGSSWWPAQRPFRVKGADGVFRPWLRPSMNHQQLVDNFARLGVVTPNGADTMEMDRDPTLGQSVFAPIS